MNNKSSIINNPVDLTETLQTDRGVKVRSFRIRA